jgi:hypothetical protein
MGSDMDGEAASDQLGISISLSADGNYLAMGTPLNDENGGLAGHVRVFSWDGTEWTQLGSDIDGEAGDQSGWSVSLSADGNYLAIGARFNNGNGGNAGRVRVFNWDGTEWTQLGNDINGEAAGDQTGWSVSLSADGSRLAAGAPPNDGNGNAAGHVRIYDWDGTEWIQLGNDIDGEAAGDRLGGSVSLSADGSILAIGATQDDGTGNRAGYTRIYRWDGTEWTQLGSDINGEAAGDEAGIRVSLSSDGSRLAVSAVYNDGNGEDSGHVRVFGDILSSTNYATGPDFSVFPNPARDEVYFRSGNVDQLQMFDSMGRLIIDEKRPGQSINISNVLAGVYFLKIVIDEMTYSVRLVKQ